MTLLPSSVDVVSALETDTQDRAVIHACQPSGQRHDLDAKVAYRPHRAILSPAMIRYDRKDKLSG
jgi:hypothetical protein